LPRLIDLDVIAPLGVTVRKNSIDYKLPGDPPVSLWLAIIDAHDQWTVATGSDANDALQLFHDRMLELFQLETPDLDELPFGPAGMFAVLSGFYGNSLDEEPAGDPQGADEAPSTTKTTSGRNGSPAKTKPPARTRSRSSR
jgi:hypothetical protein